MPKLAHFLLSSAAIATLALAVPVLAPAAQAQDKPVSLRLGHWLPAQHPLHAGFNAWGAAVEKASGGTIKTQVFPAQQLGAAKDHYDMARDGVADLTYVNPGYAPGRFPIIAGSELPFLFANAKEGSAALDSWYRKYAEKEMADVKVCLTWAHDAATYHGKIRISKPDDLKGKKIRAGNATMARLVTMAGGVNVQVAAPEARESLERGTADAITFPWDSLFIFGIDKVAKFHMDAPLYVSNFVLAMNKGTYNKLSASQKKAIDANCSTEAALALAGPWADIEAAGRTKLRAMPDHEFIKPSDADMAAWRKIGDEMTKIWYDDVKKVGFDGEKVLGELKAELKKRNSAAF